MRLAADQRAREQALDPGQSFIIQAPAGSGKTELLIQRYLTLLARVDQPEAVVAITFTIKAAGEMRERVLDALRAARTATEPEEPHAALTWRIARSVVVRDEEHRWRLEMHPSRLQILTIDALCLSIVRRMPITSGCGTQPGILEDATDLYREAARRTILLAETEQCCAESMRSLLLALDNDWGKVEELLTVMLPNRDQWLRHIAGVEQVDLGWLREKLEENIAAVIAVHLRSVRTAMPESMEAEIMRLAAYAAGNTDRFPHLAKRKRYPGRGSEDLEAWRQLGDLLLKADGCVREKFDVRVGFPPGSNREKAEMSHLIAALPEGAVAQLRRVRDLPDPHYTEDQWAILSATFNVLPTAAAQLIEIFRTEQKVDFAEIARAAITALGPDEHPTDLAYVLDCRIDHLLIDEFQDTSHTQWELIERLTAEWTESDGRTLFCVGDPMQSIFAFREADVTLFLQAWRSGIGRVRLTPLQLNANFRSDARLVEWINTAFASAFPQSADEIIAAVPLTPSVPARGAGAETPVQVHPLVCFPGPKSEYEAEAALVVDLVRQARSQDPPGTIAILFRARSHAPAIARTLREAGIRFQAVEMNSLADSMCVQDLLSLTRALLHPADRLSWLAILRAPWCGLGLADLTAVAERDRYATIWDLLQRADVRAALSEDGRKRLERFVAPIGRALRDRRRLPLRTAVESTWCELGGPAALAGETELADAETFFDVLEEFDTAGDVSRLDLLTERVAKLFSQPDPEADAAVQMLTMHKAKGLEFGTVIVPGLGRRGQKDGEKLLEWLEHSGTLVLSPIRAPGQEKENLAVFLAGVSGERRDLEEARLLYVAGTRARHCLHMVGHVNVEDHHGQLRLVDPGSDTLLKHLWPAVGMEFHQKFVSELKLRAPAEEGAGEPAPPERLLHRLPASWTSPAAGKGRFELPRISAPRLTEEEDVSFRWAGDTLRHIGTTVHATFERIAREGLDRWDLKRFDGWRARWRSELMRLGVPARELEASTDTVHRIVRTTLSEERGRWILTAHADGLCEYALTGIVDGELSHLKIDRTFVDDEGTRWVIDYKTANAAGLDVEVFLDRECDVYREQLRRYATILARFDPKHPIRVGLYFPLVSGWREWSFEETAAGAAR